MATDVDVQYFSHLNGLTLGNNWGDLIGLLDKALVTGIDFTQITAASIDDQGDVHITLYAAHNAMLFQVVELSGFAPASFNQKYRIKGVPSATELILKPHTAIVETSITTIGAGKLSALGYDIIFRDTNDVKRVYRAKNPTAQHPFIRVDESLASPDGVTGVYTSTYAKSAMVGLLEQMTHIDDYQNPTVPQLPFDSTSPDKNWKIAGVGTSVVRGWSRWYWAANSGPTSSWSESGPVYNGQRNFTLVGDSDAFYFLRSLMPKSSGGTGATKQNLLSGCGLFNQALANDTTPPWFLMTTMVALMASQSVTLTSASAAEGGGTPLGGGSSKFHVLRNNSINSSTRVTALPIMVGSDSGTYERYKNSIAAIEIPFSDSDGYLRGALKHVYFCGNLAGIEDATPMISESSMYVKECAYTSGNGGFYFYLGELQ